MSIESENIIDLYERHADAWVHARLMEGTLYEKSWLDRFCALVVADDALQARLGAFECDDPFIAAVVDIARDRGMVFSAEDVRGAMRDTWRVVYARSNVA